MPKRKKKTQDDIYRTRFIIALAVMTVAAVVLFSCGDDRGPFFGAYRANIDRGDHSGSSRAGDHGGGGEQGEPTPTPEPSPTVEPSPTPTDPHDCNPDDEDEEVFFCQGEGRDYVPTGQCVSAGDALDYFADHADQYVVICNKNPSQEFSLCIPYADYLGRISNNPQDTSGPCPSDLEGAE